jgi:Zn-dependent peptidase ImmA (M78 family)
MLNQPPPLYDADFGIVDMYSNLWDATFARPPSQRGSIFVRIDLDPEQRRFALARELLSALITSKQGRAMGLPELFLPHLRESAEFFARVLLMPDMMLDAYRKRGGMRNGLAKTFRVPSPIAALRWAD